MKSVQPVEESGDRLTGKGYCRGSVGLGNHRLYSVVNQPPRGASRKPHKN